jgi:hypothetical protein
MKKSRVLKIENWGKPQKLVGIPKLLHNKEA